MARADLRLRITQLYIEAAAAQRRAEELSEKAGIANNAFRVSSERVKAGDVSPIEQKSADELTIQGQVEYDRAARQAEAARENNDTLPRDPVTEPPARTWLGGRKGNGPPSPR